METLKNIIETHNRAEALLFLETFVASAPSYGIEPEIHSLDSARSATHFTDRYLAYWSRENLTIRWEDGPASCPSEAVQKAGVYLSSSVRTYELHPLSVYSGNRFWWGMKLLNAFISAKGAEHLAGLRLRHVYAIVHVPSARHYCMYEDKFLPQNYTSEGYTWNHCQQVMDNGRDEDYFDNCEIQEVI